MRLDLDRLLRTHIPVDVNRMSDSQLKAEVVALRGDIKALAESGGRWERRVKELESRLAAIRDVADGRVR